MRAPTLTGTTVELGGHNAPNQVTSGPAAMSAPHAWLLAAAVLAAVVLGVFAAPSALAFLAPNVRRVPAGDVTFIPARGWTAAARPTAAPPDAVTYEHEGVSFTIWTQAGTDVQELAAHVAGEFFPAETNAGAYYVVRQGSAVNIRMREEADYAGVSMVSVSPVDVGLTVGGGLGNAYPGQVVVQVWNGPAPGAVAKLGDQWGQLQQMAKSVQPTTAP